MKYLKQPFTVIGGTFLKTVRGFITTDETGIYITAKELAKTLRDVRENEYGGSKNQDISYTVYSPMNQKSLISNSAEKQIGQSSKERNSRN